MVINVLTGLADLCGCTVPPVFDYYSTRMLLAFVSSLLLTVLMGKPFIKKLYELKIGDRVRSEDCPLLGELHRNKQDTPTMGGILILFSLFISLILWMDLSHSFTLILLLTTGVMGIMGAYDDYLKLRYKNKKGLVGRKKMAIQVSFSILIGCYLIFPVIQEWCHVGHWFAPPYAKDPNTDTALSTWDYTSRLYLPFLKHPICNLPILFTLLFAVFVITGTSNAVNLTDGLDGLATGTLLFASAAFAMIAFVSNNSDLATYLNILYIEGSGEIAIYLAAFAGACMGFLWYNSHPAQVFMGDTGSLPLGAILGVSAVLLRREFLLGVIGGVFVLEALSVILQVGSYRLRNKKRVFLCAPLHHHFEYKGWPETKVVARFWIVGLLLAALGIVTLKFQ